VGFFDELFGRNEQAQQPRPQARNARRSDDEIAVERYRYLLRTAPPETIEQLHTEAFSKLTEEQRTLLFEQLSSDAPAGEAPTDTAPASLAKAATRQELRNPGTMERSLSGGGMGFGGMVASSLLGTVAGYVIGSALVSAFMPNDYGNDSADSSDSGDSTDAGADTTDAGADSGGEVVGGDMGGGDFGGGDFGGGDFGGFDF
jgi:hypothetical protein